MIPFDIVVSFVAGQALAYAARERLREEASLFFNRYLYIAVLWMAFFYAPTDLFFYHGWPDWELMYYVEAARVNPFFTLVFSVILFAAIMAGFISADYLLRMGRDRLVIAMALVLLVLLALFLLATFDRGYYVGTYAEWQAGLAVPLLQTDLFRYMTALGIVDFTVLGYVYRRFSREEVL